MARDLRGRRLLITGASSGIGRCLAEQAAAAGARVALVARSADKLNELAQALTGRGLEAVAVASDISAEDDRRRLLATVVDRFGGLDVLVNNAGVASWAHFADSSEAILRQVMEVNFFAAAELIRLAIPHLTRGHQPAIVNISSMCGRRGMPAWPEYSASKFALCGLTEALRGEMVRFGIDVLLVLPGLTRSDMSRRLLLNQGRENIKYDAGMPPEYVAAGVLDALMKNRAETVLGKDARWMLRVNRFFPRLVDHLIGRRVRKLYQEQ
jgi:short-subunit dehydrogenase